ncbi:MAG: AAA family ATPase [Desulfovibrionaceae bacterium]|nr:AAA family ATPase [Desulfovibrionaceae bacterium]
MFEKNLEDVLSKAVGLTRVYKHELLTVEHVLLALAQAEAGKKLLDSFTIPPSKLEMLLDYFLKEQVEVVPTESIDDIIQTQSVQRTLARTVHRVTNSHKRKATLADFLLSLLEESDSYAVAALQALNINHELVQKSAELGEEDFQDSNSLLHKITISLSEEAEKGRIDAIIGREKEIDRILQILARRKKNNPILIGDPGVGKTTILEGLALRIAQGDVPEQCKNMRLYILEIGSLLAGTKYRGDFEAKMQELLKELKAMPNAVLIIDEIHSIVGAGATSGSSVDAASLLKPILARGEIRCIGSTTHEEYQAYIEKDKALSRRFQPVYVDEPDQKTSLAIIEGIMPLYEAYHKVHYTQNALSSAIALSVKYMPERQLPDKAIDILDEAGASARLHAQTNTEKQKVTITTKDVERTIASMVQVPVQNIEISKKHMLQTLKADLQHAIVGQDIAIDLVTKAIIRSYLGLVDGTRPIGSFLFYGPTGVGKTELAKKISEKLAISFHRFDMSEYMEQHSVARLIGSPPGYVGFDQSGLLTDAVKKTPYCVVLLDEIEKAHPDVFNILLQVMDYGSLTDNKGRKVDFRNVILIMTSNVGVEEMNKNSIGFDSLYAPDMAKTQKALERTFSPEFRNRLDAMIPFTPLSESSMHAILDIAIEKTKTLLKPYKIRMTITDKAWQYMQSQGFDTTMGARPLQRFIRTALYDMIADAIVTQTIHKGDHITIDSDGTSLTLLPTVIPA